MTSKTYYDIVNEAIELCVITDEEMGTAYLEPRYRDLLREMDLHLPGYEKDGDATDQELWEILKLEVKKINAKHNSSHALAEWAYHILTQTVEPDMLDEENELMKNIVEYMQLKQDVDGKKEKLAKQEEEDKKKVKVPAGMSFAKKDI